ncbi:MAG: RNA methyltransferase, partial [Burkholderiales bacterium]
GLGRLHLVAPARFPDSQAEWLASGATDVLRRARVHSGLDDALAGSALTVACTARPREIAVPMVTAREAAARVVEVARSQPAALVFGNETFGLTSAEVGKCQLLATIPANPEYSSLNVAAAVQLFAYELRLAALAAEPRGGKVRAHAAHEELERFYEHLERALVEHGFLNPAHPKKLMPRLRRLFNRAQLEREEVNILRGVIKALASPKYRRPRTR